MPFIKTRISTGTNRGCEIRGLVKGESKCIVVNSLIIVLVVEIEVEEDCGVGGVCEIMRFVRECVN